MLIEKNNKYYLKASKREQSFWENDYFGTQSNGEKVIKEVFEYENLHKTGDKNLSYLDFLKSLGKFNNGLSIGGGFGEEELSIVSKGIVENMTFVDFSEGSNEILKNNAKKLNIENNVFSITGDLNFIELSSKKYDFIVCRNVLHHIINLEECLSELNQSLTDDGIIVIDEFIGANKFQWSEERIEFIHEFQLSLKNKYNIDCIPFNRTSKKTITNNCPFEAIRSEYLYTLIRFYFGDSQIYENTYGYIYEDCGFYVSNMNKDILDELITFEDKAQSKNLFPAPRLFGVYKKGNKQVIKTTLWNEKQVKENIDILPISELELMKMANGLKNMFPWLYVPLKKLYFKLRK